MKMTPSTGETRDGQPLCELRLGDQIIAKLYPNADGTKLRIVLPELKNFKQTRINLEQRLIEFERKA
jgi:hypothetical protein